MMFQSLPLLALAALASGTAIVIEVGESDLTFFPESTSAEVGDTLEFHFYTGDHSVVSGPFDKPCTPGPNAFFSGYVAGDTQGNPVYSVNVTSLDPIWIYCSYLKHCQSGMAMVVNQPADNSKTIEQYKAAAKGVAKASSPASIAGGVASGVPGSPTPSAGAAAPSGSGSASGSASTTAGGSSGSATGSAAGSATGSSTGSGSASGSASATGNAASTSANATSEAGVRTGDMGVVLGLSAVLGGLVALMG